MAENKERYKMKQEYKEIIDRCEEVRKYFGLNKFKFVSKFGMKAQTYNNFIGSQGSKPNIELIMGVIKEYNINPLWLLFNSGDMRVLEDE